MAQIKKKTSDRLPLSRFRSSDTLFININLRQPYRQQNKIRNNNEKKKCVFWVCATKMYILRMLKIKWWFLFSLIFLL